MAKVIYLTGAPAAGKSSTARMLAERVTELVVWEYGARLTEHIKAKAENAVSQEDLRSRSAGIVTPEDVAEVDQALLNFVEKNRANRPILIDSHPVTKEIYGYRVTPFSLEQVERLAPDEIWLLYVSPEETIRRITNDPGGRPVVNEEDARMHTALQTSVATSYGTALGQPVYLFDTSVPRDGLLELLTKRLS